MSPPEDRAANNYLWPRHELAKPTVFSTEKIRLRCVTQWLESAIPAHPRNDPKDRRKDDP